MALEHTLEAAKGGMGTIHIYGVENSTRVDVHIVSRESAAIVEMLHEAIRYVSPIRSIHDSPDLMDGGVTCAAIEKEAEERRADVDPQPILDALAKAHGETHEARKWATAEHIRATNAEQERDELRAAAAELAPVEVCVRGDWFKPSELPEVLGRVMDSRAEAQEEAKRYYLLAEQPRPLTADDITDEMVDRARFKGRERVGVVWSATVVRSMLEAALTELPTRPDWEAEGAERITGAVWGVELPNEAGATGTFLAARLARNGYKVVPVTEDKS